MKFGAHFCLLDADCRRYGAPKRLYLRTPWGQMIIGERTQAWLPFYGVLDWRKKRNFWPVVWHPASSGRATPGTIIE